MSPQADVEDIVSLLFCWQEAGYEMRIRDWSSDVCSSDLNVGGDMSIDSEGDMTVQGSNVNVGGNADVKADSVNILQGNDADRKTSTIGRASRRERVCQSVSISVVAVSIHKTKTPQRTVTLKPWKYQRRNI